MLGRQRVFIHQCIHRGKHKGRGSWRQCTQDGRLHETQEHTFRTCVQRMSTATRFTLRDGAGLTARLSQLPWAILDNVFAEHGAISTISAHLLSSMCRMGSPILYEPWIANQYPSFYQQVFGTSERTFHSSSSVQILQPAFVIACASKKAIDALVEMTSTLTFSYCKITHQNESHWYHNGHGRTDNSSATISGALMDATLPVVTSRTCVHPSVLRRLAATFPEFSMVKLTCLIHALSPTWSEMNTITYAISRRLAYIKISWVS